MAKPAILTVDDEPQVLRAIERDLRSHYSGQYRVIGAESGDAAIDVARQLSLRNEPLALFLVDQRMPEMTGVDLLQETLSDFPDSKRALLTAYADTEAAIAAINDVQLDYYIMKPWDPPEEKLYPILDDLLDDWQAGFRPPFEGIRVIEHRWSRTSHDLKGFLASNQVPYQSLDADTDSDAVSLLEKAGADPGQLPVVLLEDGTALMQPTNVEVADAIGLHIHATAPAYDLVIVGAGPAGLAAAVYGASEGLTTLLVEQDAPGGQAGQSSRIENYLGFPKGLSGADLARRAATQAARLGAELLVPAEVMSVTRKDPLKIIRLADGSEITCKALIIAAGVSYRMLEAPGLEDLAGIGVYYGTSRIEAAVHRGEPMFIVGAGNSAGQAAMFLSQFTDSVTMLVRRDSLAETMSQYLIDAIGGTDEIDVRFRTRLVQAKGSGRLETLVLEDRDTGATAEVAAGAIFIFIGQKARTEWVADVVELDERGFILTGADLGERPAGWTANRPPLPFESSVPGIFVAGDVRHGSIKRVASATGEGSMAVKFTHEYLADL